MKYVLFGDGIHDDTDAIQELIDSSCEVNLPAPEKYYLISRSLELHSNLKLTLPRFAEIRLAPNSDCFMLKNATKDSPGERFAPKIYDFAKKYFSYVDKYSPDFPCENIEIQGGIWNFNNKEQKPNAFSTGIHDGYSGFGFLFYNVKNLKISSMTLKDPVTFSVTLDRVSYFTVEDITFDFNDGNLYQSNMDGVHLCGNCHHGHIERLFGTCYDDIVALNAEEGSRGPITDITVKGIYTDKSYSAVRLLSASRDCPVKNVHISDIYGSFYHFCVCFMQFYAMDSRGVFENVTIDNVFASKSDRSIVKFPRVFAYRKYGIIDFEGNIDAENIRVSNVHRTETHDPTTPMFNVWETATINNFMIENVSAKNLVNDEKIPMVTNAGKIENLSARGLFVEGEPVDFC